MGSFVFKWEHPAEEVFVTGTFDGWSKSEKLIKTGDIFQKDVTLSSATEKIYYKFVVDGNWVTDHTAPQENDASGNLNNVLTIDRIVKHTPETTGIMSSVAPNSTTAELAKDVPLEKAPLEHTGSSELPGAFPETPAAVEQGDFSVNPLPATAGPGNPIYLAPGEKVPAHSDFTANTIASGVHDDPELVAADKAKEEKADFSVNPLPATDGPGNPITLAPGEKVPPSSDFTANTVTSGVHDDPELVAADKAKQEKAEAEPTFSVAPLPAFPGAVNPVKTVPGEKIPDSSTLTGNSINSSVRLDKESYENSGAFGAPVLPPVVTPQSERDQNGTGILDLPPISKNLIPESSLPIGGAGVGSYDAGPTIQSVGPQSTTANLAAQVPLESSKVPEAVKESQEEAGVTPEASAVPEEVKEKNAVEQELLKEVPVAPSTSEGTAGKGTDKSEKTVTATEAAAAVGATAVAYASSAASKLPETVQKSVGSINGNATSQATAQSTAKDTPEIVKESIAESGQSPEAAGNEEAVLEKKAVEKELLAEIKPETSIGESVPKAGLSAPEATQAGSRDVSPHTQTAPTVTTGVASATTDKTTTAPETPAKDKETPPATPAIASTPGSSKVTDSLASNSAAADKKKKRTSIFGKIKAKFSHKD